MIYTTRNGTPIRVGQRIQVYNLKHLKGWIAGKVGVVTSVKADKRYPIEVVGPAMNTHLSPGEFKVIGEEDGYELYY